MLNNLLIYASEKNMTELKNTFSWSVSSANTFDKCRRKHYLSKYAMWNGWNRDATELQKKAYRLNKMQNRYNLRGNAVEQAVLWIIRQNQAGNSVSAEQAYQNIARPYLNRCWLESREKKWQTDSKRFCCLQEHYYADMYNLPEKQMTTRIIDEVHTCLDNFIQKRLSDFRQIEKEQEIPIDTIESGDPENFIFEEIKIYAIPDYAYWKDGVMYIHDWKSGKPSVDNVRQMGVYGLWATLRHKVPLTEMRISLEYLKTGEVKIIDLNEKDLNNIKQFIQQSVSDMAGYLVDADIYKNRALPMEQWDMTSNPGECRRCKFYEICKSEIVA
jgi:CRISPR/Cas system-associated exonuclease Cas4 (RecB family)